MLVVRGISVAHPALLAGYLILLYSVPIPLKGSRTRITIPDKGVGGWCLFLGC